MESYIDFFNRINYQQAELQIGKERFIPDSRVCEKVNPDNSFKQFFGDTVVFHLYGIARARVSALIDRLYECAPECFCERLGNNTLHMTLHDLSASGDLKAVSNDLCTNKEKLLRKIKSDPIKPQSIRMKTNYIINMVDTSIVLALVPADAGEWHKLQSLYCYLNYIRVCDYPYLTPHITLGYFNYNGFGEDSVSRLKSVVYELNQSGFELRLNTGMLYYERFTDMNSYFRMFKLL